MKSGAALFVLACVFVVHVQGQARPSVRRCLCQGPGANMIHLQRVKKIEVYPASPSCENTEIIITLKNSERKRCLNPSSKFALNYIKKAIQERSAAKLADSQ